MELWNDSPGVLEETKRVARVLDIIARIASRPKVWTRRDLARAFEISERRLQQDLEIIVHRLHMPLDHCQTGYYFTEHRALPAVTFAFGEAVALLLAAGVGQATAGVDSAQLAAALARLEALFPPELRHLLGALHTDGTATGADPRRQRLLEVLQEAIATRTTVTMSYATASRDGEVTERAVDPYALVPYVRSFHLVAYCHLRREVRVFKVDRIQHLRPTAERFTMPADFDVAAYLGEGWGLMRGVAREPELVQIRLRPRAGRWVSEERWHPSQQAEWQADGTLLFSLRVGVTPAFVRWVLYYGADAEVLRPAWLAEEVRRQAEAISTLYAQREAR
ncbi:MAG: WYL domain-containing protein [Dehalococcoidales bacterium]|nr:WYL domain-containing protein [Dehalococcoidales bacterium]